MFFIGVAGQAQNGKDTLADRLCLKLNEKGENWTRSAFAKSVKSVFSETFDVDLDFIEKWKVVQEPPPGFNKNVRQSLQFIGDGFRQIMPSIWVELAFRNANQSTIFSDVRYKNEFSRIKEQGGLNIIVARPDKINNDPNDSEAQIKPYVSWLLNNFCNTDDYMDTVVDLRNVEWEEIFVVSKQPPPDGIDLFDLFVCNCGDLKSFYNAIDHYVVPFCENFVFDYTFLK